MRKPIWASPVCREQARSWVGRGRDWFWVDRAWVETGLCETRSGLAWVAAPMGAISLVLGCDLTDVGSSLLFLSLSSIFLGRNSFEGKIQTEMVLQGQRAYFMVNGNDFPFDPIFLAHQNTRISGSDLKSIIINL